MIGIPDDTMNIYNSEENVALEAFKKEFIYITNIKKSKRMVFPV